MFENRSWCYCPHHFSAVFNVCSVCRICRKIPGDACALSLRTKQTTTIATGKTREWIGCSFFKKRSYTKTANYTCVAEELEYPRREFSQESCFVATTRCEELGNFLGPLHLVLIHYLRTSGAPNDGSLLSALKRRFRLSRVL